MHCRKNFAHITDVPWHKVIKEIWIPFQKSSHKGKRKVQKQKFLKVPKLHEVQTLLKLVTEKLKEDSVLKNLTYKALMVFNMFILPVRINCRSGPLLSLTWDDVEKIKELGFIETDRHKTGFAYDISLTIESEQFEWLDRLKEQQFLEYEVNSSMVFPSSTNGIEHSYTRHLRQVLRYHFLDVSHDQDFHSNSLRKMWDTYMEENRDRVPDSLRRLHLKQTGHSESTSQSNYLVPGDCNPIVKVYSSFLSSDVSQEVSAPNESLVESKFKQSTPNEKWNTGRDLKSSIAATKRKNTPVRDAPVNKTKKRLRNAETVDDVATPVNKTKKQLRKAEKVDDMRTPGPLVKGSRNRKSCNYLLSSDDETVVSSKDPDWNPKESSEEDNFEEQSFSGQSISSSSTVKWGRSSTERALFVKSLKSFRTYNPSTTEMELMKLFYNFEGKFTRKTFDRISSSLSDLLTKQQLTRSYQKIKFAANQYL